MAKVLLIDDDPVVRSACQVLLELRGHDIFEADSGEEGIRLFESETPDLVVMDVHMPNSNGIELTKEIMQSDPEARIVLVSSASQKETVVRAVQEGAKYFMVKPFERDVFLSIIDKILGQPNRD